MRRQQSTHGREHVVRKFFLTSTTLWLVFSLMLLTAVSPSQAEIYRWKDAKGVVHYSNAAPESKGAELLDVIPTRRVPLVEDAEGQVYYLNLPDSKLTQDMSFQDVLDQLTLPADVLDELMEEASAKAKAAAEAEPLSAVTFRLTELEEALEREITKRLEWEQEYLKSQSRSKELAQRNEQLQLALVDMQNKIGKVQKAVALSEIHASALRKPQQQMGQLESRIEKLQAALQEQNPEQELGQLREKIIQLQTALSEQKPEQELGQLEEKISQLQAFLTEMSTQSEEEAAELSSTLDDVQTEQNLQLASLSGRLDELELGVTKFQGQSLAEKFSDLSQEMQDLKTSLSEGYDDSQLQARLKELHDAQKQQISRLETKLRDLESVKSSYEQSMESLSAKLGTIEANLSDLEQPGQLAEPEQEFGRLEEKIVQLQAYLTEMSQQSEEEAAELSSTLDEVKAEQGLQLASLSGRLDELEVGVSKFQTQNFAEEYAALNQEMQELKASLPEDYDDSQLKARLKELHDAQIQQNRELETKLQELERIKDTYEESIQALSGKLLTLESSIHDLDHSAVLAQIDALAERVAAFEQQPQDETIHLKLAALETAMETLTDAMPASRSNSTLVEELLESREHFEHMSAEQAEQIRIQQNQIAMLRDELEQLKFQRSAQEESEQGAPEIDPAILPALRKKNAQMEDVIQQQADALTLQQERIAAIEGKLEQALTTSKNPVLIEEQPQEAESRSSTRITVVERQFRRGAKRPSKLGVYVTK